MNCMIWNCRGAGGRNFASMVRDFLSIYQLDFLAILEPRISGPSPDKVIRKIGLIEGARGFSGGIWCLWRPNFMPVSIISSSRYCVHLKMNPNSPLSWFFSVIYANNREEVWKELKEFNSNIPGPWCLAGHFKSIMSENERSGGADFNSRASNAFVECVEDCSLIDMGFTGPPFTWFRGQLKQRLDRILCNAEWQSMFPSSSVIHVPLASSDHCGLWCKVDDGRGRPRRNYFKFIGAWLNHPDFEDQVKYSWCSSNSWDDNLKRLTSNLKQILPGIGLGCLVLRFGQSGVTEIRWSSLIPLKWGRIYGLL